jgi:hypothetical protein
VEALYSNVNRVDKVFDKSMDKSGRDQSCPYELLGAFLSCDYSV